MGIRSKTEEKLLDAAEELFFTRGIAATPVDAILDRAGVSAATLYRGYPSKEALVSAALTRRHKAWLAAWDQAIERQVSARGKLLAVFDALDGFMASPGGARWCAFLGSAAEYADMPAEILGAVRADSASLQTRLAEFAEPVVGRQAQALAEELLLVVTGVLAMRLREAGHGTTTARRVAGFLIEARLKPGELARPVDEPRFRTR